MDTDARPIADHFNRLRSLGYTRLVPIIPPDAPISPTSSLARRKDARGKAVGVMGRDGLWHGIDWVHYEADEDDLKRWHHMGAGTGIKTGDGLLAIDADTLNADHARVIRDIVEERFGRLPVRIGKYPKALYLIRCRDPYRYTRVEFGNLNDKGSLEDRVEILSDGRQFVAEGVHPGTLARYHWPRGTPALQDVPEVSAADLDQMVQALHNALPAAQKPIKEGSTSDINQDALKGQLEHVRKAVAALPNTSEHFPTREAYRDVGYAIKAALPDNETEAFHIFADWCARWQDGTNEPDTVASDWRRMKPPFRRGAGWLYELADRHASQTGFMAQLWFEQPTAASAENPFAQIELNAFTNKQPDPHITATPYSFPKLTEIPRREWLYGGHYIRQFVSTTVAPSGVGKSSLIIAEALAMASGKPILGVEPKGRFKVWLWNGEDPMDELNRRVAAAMHHHGLSPDDVGGNLFVNSGRDTEIILASETKEGVKIHEPTERAIHQQIELNALDCIQIDPFVSSHHVTENDNGAIDAVSKRWARIADVGRVSIELVHHVRKLNGNEITVEDGRGAVSLLATSRSARAIARMTKGEAQRLGLEGKRSRLFRFADGKNNLAVPADSDSAWFELASVALGNGHGEGVDALMTGDSVGVVTRWEGGKQEAMTAAAGGEAMAVVGLMRGCEWRSDVRAGDAWAGVPVCRAYGLDRNDAGDKRRARDILSNLIRRGLLRDVTKPDEKRRPRGFVEVVEQDMLS